MIICGICGMNIKYKNLGNVFQITLGNMKFGRFCGEKILYYHVKCLEGTVNKEIKLLAPLN
ncbi:MAG: hypothetical protein ACXACO_13600 [Promethearchaeota archaeon]|jgi:hypothetical protein